MTLKRLTIVCLCLLGISCFDLQSKLCAQQNQIVNKDLQLAATAAKDYDYSVHLLPSEEEQESGNAVPVLLRIVYEQTSFMKDVFPKLHEFAEMELNDPRLQELSFNSFAEQIIRAGSMSHADWEYPIRSKRPYLILLPDIQSQRQLVGRGMTAWIKQRLSKGEIDTALVGIKAQLSCGRHCAATPVVVCHLVGLSIANTALDNLELAMQSDECPNMYWSLAALSPTLYDLGPMIRWELWATPTRIDMPLPPVGDDQWTRIARDFVEVFSESTNESYSKEEGEKLQNRMEQLAVEELSDTLGFSADDIDRMTAEERVMRWLNALYCRFRSQVEPLAYQSPLEILEARNRIDAVNKDLLAASGAKSSPFPISLPQGILACRTFERRVKFLQTMESLRDYASKHDGDFPTKLDDLELVAPQDPFTEKPFLYELEGKTARLRQAEIEGFTTSVYDYRLTVR